MIVSLLAFTPNPDQLVAKAARLCVSNKPLDQIQIRDVEGCIDKLIRQNHLSPLEHANFTFGIENISRVCLAQLTRHRLASFSVRSQRFVEIAISGGLPAVFPAGFKPSDAEIIGESFNLYSTSINNGIAMENARYTLPQAVTTSLVMTMNARELLHFFGLRCCTKAQWEIRELAHKMVEIVKNVAPCIFKNAGAQCLQDGFCRQDDSCSHSIHINKLKKFAAFGGADLKEFSK